MKKLKTPLIIVNFKTYLEATGQRALELAKKSERIANEFGVNIAVAPQAVDIAKIVSMVSIPVLAQHVDPYPPGAYTGSISMEAVKEAGAVGTLINHSEKRLRIDEVDEVIKRAASIGLEVVACANTPEVAASLSALRPDFIAIEPPELIGTGKAVSKTKPEVITNTIRLIKSVNPSVVVICGAGITSSDDVEAAIKLGTQGVLVASGVVRAKDQEEALRDLVRGLVRAYDARIL
ncbi:MAG: triose-phosphate isomerase [Candidatus Nezhaarchaeales archaeon]|nr:MAG: triose-phosphate isomerase [Candidatus Nezhaarchaeota archaeon WYZ-LMO8]TDA37242.1 MAG: triose-phosphate isomerase [Candidatus Nezhaarchaeota archaeon WYZ-LMO7]